MGVPHKQLGTRLVFGQNGQGPAGLAAMAVLGHHGGLTDPEELRLTLQEAGAEDPETTARFLLDIPEAAGALLSPRLFPRRSPKTSEEKLSLEMRLRMVFSALVDADHLDTAAHRQADPGPRVAPPADMAALTLRFEQRRAARITSADDKISLMRTQVYEAAVDAAALPPGIFRLAAPTGLGKTFAQGAFALHHAARWNKARVIVAVPFITVTEQNAAVYRRLLDTDDQPVVLEHHSSVRFHEPDNDEKLSSGRTADRWARLAAENWDAPFTVTTTVQLFESMFGRKPSRIRKLHRLANAVIVLDEVQALPTLLLVPILSGLRTLAEDFGTTVLLTSATQPEFQALSPWLASQSRGSVSITPVIADPQPLFEQSRRVHYQWRLDPQPTWQQIADELRAQDQAMVVVNSVADARHLYQLASSDREIWHLSTRMCPQHRRAVLETVTQRLRAGKPTLLIATQLVEAGVDLSFPIVWRALAPADSIQQAAGRANRNGEIPEGGLVIVFDPAEGHQPAEYRPACALTLKHFGHTSTELDDQLALARYYKELYKDLRLDSSPLDQTKTPLGHVVQRNRQALDYRAVTDGPLTDTGTRDSSRAFRMIADESVPLVIADHEDTDQIQALLSDLAAGTITSGLALRRLQPWTVQLPTTTANRADVAPLIETIVGDLGRWKGTYDWNPATSQGVGLDEAHINIVF
ncbi:CRISPR-associated endonuclease/helicase Cas3 [Nocardia goodfellowii]|uniref:CRISPR-associated endonuclease/helicase Cas3 n=1 Tax=Nocardia goodfellowii TaxID=882446 RepID=A0ABS4QJ52_9NOCA|nr:CRISPR-associated endonuclease/helicase Cas3 [Nocardia goodfellowii]